MEEEVDYKKPTVHSLTGSVQHLRCLTARESTARDDETDALLKLVQLTFIMQFHFLSGE